MLLFYASALFATARIGVAFPINGQSFIREKTGKFFALKQASALHLGDMLITKDGHLQAYFLDGSQIQLGEQSSLKIVSYSFGQKNHAHYRMQNGVFRFHVGKIAQKAPQNFTISTHLATIGIRGSAGEIWTSDGSLGFLAGLKVSVKDKHALIVKDQNNNSYHMHQAKQGLMIDENLKARWFRNNQSIFDLGFIKQAKRLKKRRRLLLFPNMHLSEPNFQHPELPAKFPKNPPILGDFHQELQNLKKKRKRKSKTYQKISEEKVKSSENSLKEIDLKKERSTSMGVLEDLAKRSLKFFYKSAKALTSFFR